MAATTPPDTDITCEALDATPVTLHTDDLPSTAPSDLRAIQHRLTTTDRIPARLQTTVTFDDDCPFAINEIVTNLRDYLRAADFLGITTFTIAVTAYPSPAQSAIRDALTAFRERAHRHGITVTVTGFPLDTPVSPANPP